MTLPATQPQTPSPATAPPLSVRDLNVAYRRKVVLWDADFDVPPGSLTALVGPNGAGKSTALKACLELIPRASGQVLFYGEPYHRMRHRVAYVPQRESVDWDFPVSALDVVCMGLYRQVGWCMPVRKKHRQRAMEALVHVGLADFAHRQISQLSGGQQQRAAIARALINDPLIVLADEPTGNLDTATGETILGIFEELRRQGRTIIMVTHEPDVAQRCDRIITMRDGVVVSDERGTASFKAA